MSAYLSIKKICLLCNYLVNTYIVRIQFSVSILGSYCLRNFKLRTSFVYKFDSFCTIICCFADDTTNAFQDCKVLCLTKLKFTIPQRQINMYNVFRIAGDFGHLFSFIILFYRFWKTGSCAGKFRAWIFTTSCEGFAFPEYICAYPNASSLRPRSWIFCVHVLNNVCRYFSQDPRALPSCLCLPVPRLTSTSLIWNLLYLRLCYQMLVHFGKERHVICLNDCWFSVDWFDMQLWAIISWSWLYWMNILY